MMLTAIHFLAGLVVLAEALNKLERTDATVPGLGHKARVVVWLKLLAWSALAMGAAGAVAAPFIDIAKPDLQDVCTMAGFAMLVIRSRLKEAPPDQPKPSSDDFNQTQVIKP